MKTTRPTMFDVKDFAWTKEGGDRVLVIVTRKTARFMDGATLYDVTRWDNGHVLAVREGRRLRRLTSAEVTAAIVAGRLPGAAPISFCA